MIVKILGSSAGGGFPQWNCACPNCYSLRSAKPIGDFYAKPRFQSQVALSADGKSWHLLNASPDLRMQIEQTPALHPSSNLPLRQSPIESVLITNADLDHVLGLLLLRESQPLRVYCAQPVQEILRTDNSFFRALEQFEGQCRWETIEPGKAFELKSADGKDIGIKVEPIFLSGRYPKYVSAERARILSNAYPEQAVLGLIIENRRTHKKLAFFPGMDRLETDWIRRVADCEVLLLDGTFWTNTELQELEGSGKATKTAQQMGHVPLSGAEGSIARLAGLTKVRKVFTHINNTNPILNERSAQHQAVLKAGWEIAHDGWECEL